MTLKTDVQRIAKLCGDDQVRQPVPPGQPLPAHGGYALRLRWATAPYARMRNAAWLVRNSRVANDLSPLALQIVLQEAENLVRDGEPLFDVLEAFAELLRIP